MGRRTAAPDSSKLPDETHLREERIQELSQNAPRRAPHHVLPVAHEYHGSPDPLTLPLLQAERARLEQMRQRDLDHALDLPAVRVEARRAEGQRQHRRDAE